MRPVTRRLGAAGAFGAPRPARSGAHDGTIERSEASEPEGTDVYSTLGIEQPLEPDEERALGEVLNGFHKLLRHIHESARQKTGSPAEKGQPGRNGHPDDGH